MSSSSEYSEISGNKPAKSPEKSTFSQTCNLLSQYIKEKGSFGDLTLGMTCNTEQSGSPETSCQSATTMNLFPTKENNITPKNLTTMDLLSPKAEFPPLTNNNSSSIKTKGSKGSQLTIFYGGQVIVFDDFPADRANELMAFVNKGVSQSQNNNSIYTYTQSQPSFPSNLVKPCADNSSAPIIPQMNISNPQAPSRPVVCDLPLARNASLHRFLAKRKDRIASKAPYQATNPTMGASKIPAESMSWLGLGAKSTQI